MKWKKVLTVLTIVEMIIWLIKWIDKKLAKYFDKHFLLIFKLQCQMFSHYWIAIICCFSLFYIILNGIWSSLIQVVIQNMQCEGLCEIVMGIFSQFWNEN